MPIKKLVPKVPDPYISKNEQNQFWPARFGHLDYLVDQINDGGAIPEGFTQIFTELITIPGTTWATFPGPLYVDFPADGLSQQLNSQGKYIIPISFTVFTLESVSPIALPLILTKFRFSIWNNTFTNGTVFTDDFDINYSGGAFPAVSVKYIPIVSAPPINIDPTGTKFRLERDVAGGGGNGTSTNCVKILFTFQAIDINWLFKLTN